MQLHLSRAPIHRRITLPPESLKTFRPSGDLLLKATNQSLSGGKPDRQSQARRLHSRLRRPRRLQHRLAHHLDRCAAVAEEVLVEGLELEGRALGLFELFAQGQDF